MRMCSVPAVVVCAMITATTPAVFSGEEAPDLANHAPRFRWVTDSNGNHAIYDGSRHVADFYGGSDELTGIGRPISLHNLRRIPGGPRAIRAGESCGPLCLSWRKHLIFYMKIDELAVNDDDPAILKLYVKSHDVGLRADRPNRDRYEPKNVVEQSWLELTYDPSRPSYVFDVRTRLDVQPGREQRMIDRDLRGLEFADILPGQCNVPLDRKQFHHYVYRGHDGGYYRLPHDKNRGPEKRDLRFCRGGTLAFLLDPHHNPVVELVGDTGLHTFSEICHAMYDVHFKFDKQQQLALLAAGEPLEAHFRFYSISEAAGRAMLTQADWDPKLSLPGAMRPPMHVGVVYGFAPAAENGRSTGPFAPVDETDAPDRAACQSDDGMGYCSDSSLSIERTDSEGQAAWRAWLDPHHSPGLEAGKRYRLKTMVRTRNVKGCVRLAWKGDDGQVGHSAPVSGTSDWQPVTLDVGPVAQRVTIDLVQKGAGQSWFDDVLIDSLERNRAGGGERE